VFEWAELRAYASGSEWWLGARTLRPGDIIQPLAGPLATRGFGVTRLVAEPGDTVLEVRIRVPPTAPALNSDSTVLRLPLIPGGTP